MNGFQHSVPRNEVILNKVKITASIFFQGHNFAEYILYSRTFDESNKREVKRISATRMCSNSLVHLTSWECASSPQMYLSLNVICNLLVYLWEYVMVLFNLRDCVKK